MLDGNKEFLTHVLRRENICSLVLPCLYLMWNARSDESKVGLVHICTFILLLLSGERNFGVALNQPYDATLRLRDAPIFTGTHADLLIVVSHKIIVSGSARLKTLYNCFLTILSNVSPYAKSISLVPAIKLLSLFEVFSTRHFLFAGPNNHQYIFFLLDVFNNLIQYQYEGNAHVIYAIVRRRKIFESLADIAVDEPASPPEGVTENGNGKKKKFRPTEAWLATWRPHLPLGTIMRMLHFLAPQVAHICQTHDGANNEAAVLSF